MNHTSGPINILRTGLDYTNPMFGVGESNATGGRHHRHHHRLHHTDSLTSDPTDRRRRYTAGALDTTGGQYTRHRHRNTHRSTSHPRRAGGGSASESDEEMMPSTSEYCNSCDERDYESEGVMNSERGMLRYLYGSNRHRRTGQCLIFFCNYHQIAHFQNDFYANHLRSPPLIWPLCIAVACPCFKWRNQSSVCVFVLIKNMNFPTHEFYSFLVAGTTPRTKWGTRDGHDTDTSEMLSSKIRKFLSVRSALCSSWQHFQLQCTISNRVALS
jgi:hypothetical protein